MADNSNEQSIITDDELYATITESVEKDAKADQRAKSAVVQHLRNATVTGVDLGADGNIDTPQQIMAKEIKAAQAVADAIDAKRAGLMSEASRRALEIRAAQERLAKLNEAQKGTMERIRACDKAAQVHRQTVFALQEAGR